jgi:diguanylate cyclase (GGDEF)-like protein
MDTVTSMLGGDGFVVILSKQGADKAQPTAQAAAVAEKISVNLNAPYQLTLPQPGEKEKSVEHRCSVSIGVVPFINHQGSPTDLMKWTDAANYETREEGRNGVQFYQGK